MERECPAIRACEVRDRLVACANRLVEEADRACGRCTLKSPVQKATGNLCGACFQRFVNPLRDPLIELEAVLAESA